MLSPSAHVDTFTRDNLPPADQWPTLEFTIPDVQYPERLNAAAELLMKAARYARRVEAVALEPRYDLRTRESRVRPLANARTLFRFGWATRSRRPGINNS